MRARPSRFPALRFEWLAAGLAVLAAGLGLGIARAPIVLGAALVASIGFGLATLIEPLVGLAAALLLGPAKALIAIAVPGVPSDWGQAALAAALAAWLARSLARREVRFELPAPLPLLLGFTAVGALSLVVATDFRNGLTELAKWVQIVLVASIAYSESRAGKARWILFTILFAGLVQAGIGVWQFGLRGTGPETFSILNRFYRAYGTFEQPNPFGGYMGMVWPVAAGLAWGLGGELWRSWAESHRHRAGASRDGSSRELGRPSSPVGDRLRPPEFRPAQPPARTQGSPSRFADLRGLKLSLALLAAGITAGMSLAALGASFSRGAWMGAAAAAGVMLLFLPRRRWLGLGLVAGTLVALPVLIQLGWVPRAVSDRLADVGEFLTVTDVRGVDINDGNFALVERLALWQAATKMAETHPWLGVGLGNYEAAYPQYRLVNWPLALGHAHNFYLNTLAETGLIGLAAYLGLWAGVFLATIRAARSTGGWERGLAIGLLGAFTHLSTHHLVDNLLVNNLHLTVGALFGLLAYLSVPSRQKET